MDYIVTCPHCEARIEVMAVQIGQSLRCAHCQTLFMPGDPEEIGGPDSPPDLPPRPTGGRFTFRCELCHSMLEGFTGLIGKLGQCPTCGAQFRIPRPNETAERQAGTAAETESLQPIHAFAAAGEKAPAIIRRPDGTQAIQCPKCGLANEVTQDNCVRCSTAFTLEGSASIAPSRTPMAALIAAIIGVPTAPAVVPSLLGIILGWIALKEPATYGGHRVATAWVAIALGGLGVALAALFYIAL